MALVTVNVQSKNLPKIFPPSKQLVKPWKSFKRSPGLAFESQLHFDFKLLYVIL